MEDDWQRHADRLERCRQGSRLKKVEKKISKNDFNGLATLQLYQSHKQHLRCLLLLLFRLLVI